MQKKLNISQELSAFEKYHIYDKSKVRYVSQYDEFEATSVEHSDYARNLSSIWRIWLYAKYHAITYQTGWISVNDALPKKDGMYLTYTQSAEYAGINLTSFTDGKFRENLALNEVVTHWQPLPEPPKTQGVVHGIG